MTVLHPCGDTVESRRRNPFHTRATRRKLNRGLHTALQRDPQSSSLSRTSSTLSDPPTSRSIPIFTRRRELFLDVCRFDVCQGIWDTSTVSGTQIFRTFRGWGPTGVVLQLLPISSVNLYFSSPKKVMTNLKYIGL